MLTGEAASSHETGDGRDPLLDRGRIEEIAQGDLELERVLFLEFLDEARPLIERFRSNLELGNLTEIARDAHGLRSICLTLGISALAESAGRVEAAAEAGAEADMAKLVSRSDQDFENLKRHLSDRFGTISD